MRLGILHDRSFRLVLAAGTISNLGSMLLVVAVPFQVFQLTGSTLATGLTLAVEALPAMLIGPCAGVLVDRWSRRTTMVVADVCSAAGVALMLLGTAPDRIGFIYLGLLAENVAVVFFRPAARAIIPTVVGTGTDLAAANSLSAFAGGVVRLVGPPLGTLALSVGGLGLVVGFDVASYLASAAMIATGILAPAARPVRGRSGVRQIPAELRDGMRHLAGTPLLRGLLITSWVYWTANAALTALLVPFVVKRLGSPGQDLGYLVAGLGIGYLLGSAVSRPLITRYPTRPILVAGYAAVGACFLALFNAPTLVAATAATALAGIPGAVVMAATQHRLQAATPEAILGRVGAAFYASDATAAVTGGLLAPVLTAAAGLPGGLDILSATVLATAAAAVILLPASRPGSGGGTASPGSAAWPG
jgi:MFS family permease